MATRANSVRAREGRTGEGRPSIDDELRRLTVIAWFAAAFASAVLVGGIALATGARGEEVPRHWFELYSADRDAPRSAFRWKLKVGPFSELWQCYAVGTLSLDNLNHGFPTKDFLGRCAGDDLLTLRELEERAKALMPPDDETANPTDGENR